MKADTYTIRELAEAKGTTAPVAAALLAMEAKLVEAVRIMGDLADDLETEINARWGYDERLKRQWNRDMVPVIEAREFIEKLGANHDQG